MSRVAIFAKGQNPLTDEPAHSASPSFVSLLIKDRSTKLIACLGPTRRDQSVLLLTDEPWISIKQRLRPCKHYLAVIPKAVPAPEWDGQGNLDLGYPNVWNVSVHHKHLGFIEDIERNGLKPTR